MESRLQETLGTRVHIERRQTGGQITIDFFTHDDLRTILDVIKSNTTKTPTEMLDSFVASQTGAEEAALTDESGIAVEDDLHLMDDRTPSEIAKTEEEVDLYNIKNFSI